MQEFHTGKLYELKPEIGRSVLLSWSLVNEEAEDEADDRAFFEKGMIVLSVFNDPASIWLVCLYGDKLVGVSKSVIQELI